MNFVQKMCFVDFSDACFDEAKNGSSIFGWTGRIEVGADFAC